tara:strand:- start:404 stop:535 length:132 start_codon:yes stop_codon:yes gene_type:complete
MCGEQRGTGFSSDWLESAQLMFEGMQMDFKRCGNFEKYWDKRV